MVKPETLLDLAPEAHRQKKFDGSTHRHYPGRPRHQSKKWSNWSSNSPKTIGSWGYDRIVGALKNVGYTVSHQTIGNILKRHDLPTCPGTKKDHNMARVYSLPLGHLGRHRFLHGRSLDEEWVGDLLHPVFPPG